MPYMCRCLDVIVWWMVNIRVGCMPKHSKKTAYLSTRDNYSCGLIQSASICTTLFWNDRRHVSQITLTEIYYYQNHSNKMLFLCNYLGLNFTIVFCEHVFVNLNTCYIGTSYVIMVLYLQILPPLFFILGSKLYARFKS